jgi:hypothetical protein
MPDFKQSLVVTAVELPGTRDLDEMPVRLRVKPDRRRNPLPFPQELERRVALQTRGYSDAVVVALGSRTSVART